METRANTSYPIRAFAQVTGLTLFLLECLYKALRCLSGMCFNAFVRMACYVSVLYVVLTTLPNRIMQVAERSTVMGFIQIKAHNRKYALFTGRSVAVYTGISLSTGWLMMLKKRETLVHKKYDEH